MNDSIKIVTRFGIVALLIVALFAYLYYSPTNNGASTEKKSSQLIVGSNVLLPFAFYDESEQLVGFDIAVIKAVAEKLGKQPVFDMMSFDSLIIALKQGKVDLIISGMHITPSRLHQINMVNYTADDRGTLSLLFWEKVPKNVASLADMRKEFSSPRVTTMPGSPLLTYVESEFEDFEIHTFAESDEILLDIRYGRSDAALFDTITAKSLATQHRQLKIVTFEVPAEHQFAGHGIGISKNNAELTQAVERAVQELKADGTLKKLAQKWLAK